MVVSPFQVKTVIPPCRVIGSGISGILPLGQLTHFLRTVTIGLEGRIRIQMYNCSPYAKMLSPKMVLAGVKMAEQSVVSFCTEDELKLQDEEGSAVPNGQYLWDEEQDRNMEQAVEQPCYSDIRELEKVCNKAGYSFAVTGDKPSDLKSISFEI